MSDSYTYPKPVHLASSAITIPVATGLSSYLVNTFGFAIGINQPTASTDNPLLYIRNPTGSGKTLYVSVLSYGIAVANVLGVVRLYKNPAVSANGTAQTIASFGGGVTAMLLTSVPTVTSNGSLLYTGVSGQNASSLIVPLNYEIMLSENSSLLITGSPGSNGRQADLSVRWIEL